ncbi:hypothetical protein WA171_002989 [Blastocystis sp. BT1]
MQKRFQQLAGAALDSLGLSRIEDEQLIAHLDTLDEVESYLRDVEKASNDVYSSFESTRDSTSNLISSTSELLQCYNKDPTIRNAVSRFKKVKSVCETSLDKQIKSRIEENIFAKLELRRDVLHAIHKQIEECSQLVSRHRLVLENYNSIKADEEALKLLTEAEIADMQQECDKLRIAVEEQRIQLDGDVTNYVTNTLQFIVECYSYLGNLTSLIQASLHTAVTFTPDVPANLYPPESATKETIQLSLKAGLSTIQCVEVKKGEHIWWEVSASGDLGFGVLFKNAQDPKEAEKGTQEMGIETVEAVHRIDPSTEEIRGHLECEKDGLVEFGFDNSYSYFRGKSIEINVFKQ